MPDIMLLPDIVRILEVTLEELYGLANKTEMIKNYDLPWEDDGVLRGVVFEGRRLVHTSDLAGEDRVVFSMEGDARDVWSEWDLEITGNVGGSAKAHRDMHIGGSVAGGASSGRDMSVGTCLSGGASCGRDLDVGGDLSGGVSAGRDVAGADIHGSVSAARGISAHSIHAGTVKGDVSCETLECERIEGNIKTSEP